MTEFGSRDPLSTKNGSGAARAIYAGGSTSTSAPSASTTTGEQRPQVYLRLQRVCAGHGGATVIALGMVFPP